MPHFYFFPLFSPIVCPCITYDSNSLVLFHPKSAIIKVAGYLVNIIIIHRIHHANGSSQDGGPRVINYMWYFIAQQYGKYNTHNRFVSVSLQRGFAIGRSFLSQRKQPHLLYERTEQFVVYNSCCKMCCMQMLVRGRTILLFYWVYKRMLKNRSVCSCTTMQRN